MLRKVLECTNKKKRKKRRRKKSTFAHTQKMMIQPKLEKVVFDTLGPDYPQLKTVWRMGKIEEKKENQHKIVNKKVSEENWHLKKKTFWTQDVIFTQFLISSLKKDKDAAFF